MALCPEARARCGLMFVHSGQFILLPCDEACFAIASGLPSNADLAHLTSKLETLTCLETRTSGNTDFARNVDLPSKLETRTWLEMRTWLVSQKRTLG